MGMWTVEMRGQINTDHVMIMGRNALYYEDYVLGIQRFNMVISAKPFLSEPYFYRGLAKFYLEDYAGTVADCSSAIERNPYMENTYVLRGLARVNLGLFAEAVEDYRKATGINPMSRESWYNMTLCLVELERYDEADLALDTLIRQWPREASGYTLRAEIAMQQADTTRALTWIDRALEVDSYSGQAWGMRAIVTLSRGLYAKGEEELDKAIVQLPRQAGLYVNRALARYNQNNLRGAMADYDTALEMEPGNYVAHFNRALLRAQVGDDNNAIDDFNFVLEQEPDNTIALYNRALLLERTGDYRGALRDISEVIKAYPEFWAGYAQRAEIRRKTGDIYGAERDEFKVLKAEMDKRAGTYKSTAQGKTRKKSERDPSQYDKLVIDDSGGQEKSEYASEYRGRVQDRTVELRPEPMYVLSYGQKESSPGGYIAYNQLVEELNTKGNLPYHLYLTVAPPSATEGRIDALLNDIAAASREMEKREKAKTGLTTLLMRRAIDYYHVRDFASALADLDSLVSLSKGGGTDLSGGANTAGEEKVDKGYALAYFLRAQTRYAQLQVEHPTPAIDTSPEARIGYAQVREDLERTLALAPDMLYAHYALGNLHVLLGHYTEAIEAYTRALDVDPTFPYAYYNRGVAWLLSGKTDEALRNLSQAGEYGLYSAYNLIKRYSRGQK